MSTKEREGERREEGEEKRKIKTLFVHKCG